MIFLGGRVDVRGEVGVESTSLLFRPDRHFSGLRYAASRCIVSHESSSSGAVFTLYPVEGTCC